MPSRPEAVTMAQMEGGGTTPEYSHFRSWCGQFESASDPRIPASIQTAIPIRTVSSGDFKLQAASLMKDGKLTDVFLVSNALTGKPATRWSLELLKRDYGDSVVVVNDRAPARRADATQGPQQRSLQVHLGDYITYIEGRASPFSTSPPTSAPFYLNGWNGPSQIDRLRADFPVFDFMESMDRTRLILKELNSRIFGATSPADWCDEMNKKLDKVFVGPAGTVTRLHYDAQSAHGWLAQIQGSKLFVLYPPEDTPHLYQLSGETHTQQSAVDPLDPDLEDKFPLSKNARPRKIVLRPGEAIIIPEGWWHYAVALEPSVTVQRNFYSLGNAGSLVSMVLGTVQRVQEERKIGVVTV